MSDWDPHWSAPLSPPSALHDEAPSDASAASRVDFPRPPSALHDKAPSDASAASRVDSPRLQAAAPPATMVASHGGSSPMSHQVVAPPATAVASHDGSSPMSHQAVAPPATVVTSHGGSSPMSCLNTYIKEYLVQLGLSELASLFMEEAEKNLDIPPVPFVRMWVQLESQMIPCSPPSYDKQMAPMLSLNEGIEKYLEHLQIDRRRFSEKAWRHVVRRIPLIAIWMERIYPQIDAGTH